MRQIKYILIDEASNENRGRNGRHIRLPNVGHHYVVNSKGLVSNPVDIRTPVHVIDGKMDPDGYNANSVVVRLGSGFKVQGSKCLEPEMWNLKQRDALKNLLVELRSHFPEAMIFGIREIGDYFIKVSDEMNELRLELSELD